MPRIGVREDFSEMLGSRRSGEPLQRLNCQKQLRGSGVLGLLNDYADEAQCECSATRDGLASEAFDVGPHSSSLL